MNAILNILMNLIEVLYFFIQPDNWLIILSVAGGLGFVIFVHELGHFAAAKWCGVRCDKFYIGFDLPLGKLFDWVISLPIKLFNRKFGGIVFFQKFIPSSLFKYKKGETLYGVGIIPLGGYVKMLGQEDNPAQAAEEMKLLEEQRKRGGPPSDPNAPQLSAQRVAELTDPRSYVTKTVPQRLLIITAGVIMNVIFAFIMATIAHWNGVRMVPGEVGEVFPGGAGWQANMRPGDVIKKINDQPINYFQDLQNQVIYKLRADDNGIPFQVARDGDEKNVQTLIVKPRNDKGAPMILIANAHTLELQFPADETLRVRVPNHDLVGEVVADPNAKTPAGELPKPDKKLLRLKSGDKIVSVNGAPITSETGFFRALLKISDQPFDMIVESSIPAKKSDQKTESDKPEEKAQPFWMQVKVPPLPRRDLGIVMTLGSITALQSESPASKAGLEVGDKILKLNGEDVGNPETLDQRLQKLAGQEVTLTVARTEKSNDKEKEKTPVEAKTLDIKVTPRTIDWVEESIEDQAVAALGICCKIEPVVKSVRTGSPADKVGIKASDVIEWGRLGVPEKARQESSFGVNWKNPTLYTTIQHLQPTLGLHSATKFQFADPTRKVILQVKGEKEPKEFETVPSTEEFVVDRGLALKGKEEFVHTAGVTEAVKKGAKETWENLTKVVVFLRKLRNSEISPKMLGGPVTIATSAGMAATGGWSSLLLFLTMLSANLAVVNILPIPVLDGGHVVFLLYEGITGKPPNARVFEFLTMIGFLLLLSLMVFVLGLDFGFISRR